MNSSKDDLEAGQKSWVSSRYYLIMEAGVPKRKCKHIDCTKEYSRGTSHQTLRRHWTKDHGTNDSELTGVSTKHMSSNRLGTPSKSKKKKLPESNSHNSSGLRNKTPANQSVISNPYDRKSFTADKAQFDVKLVAKRLKEATSIHLTFDIHTTKKGGYKSIGVITAHSLSDGPLDLKSVVLEYKHLPYPDDSASLFEFVRSCIAKFNIREKILSITSSCSSSAISAIQEIEKRLRISKNFNFPNIHIKCFPQFIHLNVMELLRSDETTLENVRKVINHINSNNVILRPMMPENTGLDAPSTLDKNDTVHSSQESQSSNQTNSRSIGLKLPLDSRNSWNTTYNMIDIFLQQRSLIEPTLLYFQSPHDLTNITIDWDKLLTIKALLKPFYQTISHFSSYNDAPIGLIVFVLPKLISHLSSSSWTYDDLAMAAHNFSLEIESYQGDFLNELTVMAGLLDPRVKSSFLSEDTRGTAVESLKRRVEGLTGFRRETDPDPDKGTIWEGLYRPLIVDEITDYLTIDRAFIRMKVADYWNLYRECYPGLFQLAKILCCIQASSVPGDRMFSAAENVNRDRKVQPDSAIPTELVKSWQKYLEK